MTNPPPSGNWGPPQPPYGQGQPPHGPGQWPPQQGWGPPPAPPENNNLKWLLIGVAVLLVIAISVGATVLFTRDSGGGTTQTASGNPPAAGDIASANDKGPVSIITEDPTCDAWRPINDTLARKQAQGWGERDYSQPASSWTPTERSMHDDIAAAMRSAADQTVGLARTTPHRLMRELYEQAIAYWRGYADSIPTYTAVNNHLAGAARNASGALVSICAAITYKSASARTPLVNGGGSEPPSGDVGDPSAPAMFLAESKDPACDDWIAASDDFQVDSEPWRNLDPNIAASEWNPDRTATMEQMGKVFTAYADNQDALGEKSQNSVFNDLASLSSLYWRAFAAAIPSYTTADTYLSNTASYVDFLILDACKAAGN